MIEKNRLIKQMIEKEALYSSVMTLLFVSKAGVEGLNWAPQTIYMELVDEYNATPNRGNMDRLMAGVSLLTSDSFYKVLPDFNDLCNILSGDLASPNTLIPADVFEISWGITEACLLSPPEDTEQPYSPEISAFVEKIMMDSGLTRPPDMLNFVKIDPDYVKKVRYSYSDDVEMFQSINTMEQSKLDDINGHVKDNLKSLLNQLERLNMPNWNIDRLIKAFMKHLN